MSNRADQDHYSDEDWVDFVRDAAPPDRHDAMQRHLAAGCQSCREVRETWKAVLGVVREEPSFEPPAGVMRLARAVYGAMQPQPRFSLATATAKLLFDSQRTAAVAGVRTLRLGPRKLLYENEECLVDLQIESSKDRAKIVLIGQVMALDKDEPRVAGLQVLVLRQVREIARTKTNPLGEFRVELDGTGDDLSLAIDLNYTAMFIPLGDLR